MTDGELAIQTPFKKGATRSRDGTTRFGKGYVAPTRNEAEKNPDKFYELIAYLIAKRKLKWEMLKDPLSLDPTNVARRITAKTLDPDQRKLTLDYLFEESSLILDPAGTGLSAIRDSLYFAFVHFFEIKATSQHNASARAGGTYQLWRHSVEDSGEFVFGRLDFYEDEASGALRVKMIQPRKPRDGMRGSVEEFSGYLFRVADMYAMLLRDSANNDVRMTIFPRFRIEKIGTDKDPASVFAGTIDHIVHMDGYGLGIDGNNLFFSPVYIELVDDRDQLAVLDERLDVVTQVPDRIASRLAKCPFVVR